MPLKKLIQDPTNKNIKKILLPNKNWKLRYFIA